MSDPPNSSRPKRQFGAADAPGSTNTDPEHLFRSELANIHALRTELVDIRKIMEQERLERRQEAAELKRQIASLLTLVQLLPTAHSTPTPGTTKTTAGAPPVPRTKSNGNTTVTPTYANVTKSTTNNAPEWKTVSTKKPKATTLPTDPLPAQHTRKDRQFVIIRQSSTSTANVELTNNQHIRIKDTINTALKGTGCAITQVSNTLKGNLHITTRADNTAEQVIKAAGTHLLPTLQTLDLNITAIHINNDWEKVVVHGIQLSYYEDMQDGMDKLKQDLKFENPGLLLRTLPHYITKPEQRETKLQSSVAFAVSDKATAASLTRRGVAILAGHHKVAHFQKRTPFSHCRQCLNKGHDQPKCTNTPRCALCAGTHTTNEHKCDKGCATGRPCAHTALKCLHCEEPHRAFDRTKCTYQLEALKRFRTPPPSLTTTTTTAPTGSDDTMNDSD